MYRDICIGDTNIDIGIHLSRIDLVSFGSIVYRQELTQKLSSASISG